MPLIKSILKLILLKPLFNALIFLVWVIPGNSVGLAIVILTLLIRVLLYPSSKKATESQKHLRELQPEVEKIKQKYQDDKVKQNQAILEFYRQNKINPASGCLPLLIQLPILIILYYVIRFGLNTARFDLLYSFTPRPEQINHIFFGIDLSKPDLWILPILTGILQFVQSKQVMGMTTTKSEDMTAMISQSMIYFFPVMTVIIARTLPAALPLYWMVTTLFSIGQQWWTFRKKEEHRLPALSQVEGPALQQSAISNQQSNIKERVIKKEQKKGVELTIRRKK